MHAGGGRNRRCSGSRSFAGGQIHELDRRIFSGRKNGARYRVRTCDGTPDNQALVSGDTQIDTQNFGQGIAEVSAAWPDLPKALKAAVLAIIRTHRRDLSTNRGSGTQRSEVERSEGCGSGSQQASHAGAQPEQPVCGQVGRTARPTRKRKPRAAESATVKP